MTDPTKAYALKVAQALLAELPHPYNMMDVEKLIESIPLPIDQRNSGLYHKFTVTRTDGRDQVGGDREGATYFVLDVKHDKFSKAALLAYAYACKQEYPVLFADMVEVYGLQEATALEAAAQEPWVDATLEHDKALLELIGKIDPDLDGSIADVGDASDKLDAMQMELAYLREEVEGYKGQEEVMIKDLRKKIKRFDTTGGLGPRLLIANQIVEYMREVIAGYEERKALNDL